MLMSGGIEGVLTKFTNPQTNEIIEHIHKVITSMIHTTTKLVKPTSTMFHLEQQLYATQPAVNTPFHTSLKDGQQFITKNNNALLNQEISHPS